jgi:hypothetical protein
MKDTMNNIPNPEKSKHIGVVNKTAEKFSTLVNFHSPVLTLKDGMPTMPSTSVSPDIPEITSTCAELNKDIYKRDASLK